MTPKQRAEPLSRDERRKAILEAVIPLIVERGARVTTSEMAEAACIAEGTIFRVFPDKPTLIREAVKSSFDPRPDVEALGQVDDDADLETRVRTAAAVLERRFDRVHTLYSVARSLKGSGGRHGDGYRIARDANDHIVAALTELLAGAEDELAVSPAKAAAVLNGLMFAIHFPFNTDQDALTRDDVVTLLLNGVRARND